MAYSMVAEKPGKADVLVLKEHEAAKPKSNEVLIRHTAIGVNFIDVYMRSGLYPWAVEKDLVLGSEAAGVIEAIGDKVSEFVCGDRVAYTTPHGAYTSHRIIESQHLVKIPSGVSDEVAAASVLKGLTAHYLLHRSFKVEPGHSVLFHAAAGGVGLIAGQWLAAKGVTTIGTAGGSKKCDLAAKHGYDHMIDYHTEDIVERVMAITHQQGVDGVYDSVGKDTLASSIKSLKMHGTVVNFGQSSGPALDFKIADLATGSLHLTRPSLFNFTSDPQWLKHSAAELFSLIANNTIKININQTFALNDVASAHKALESRQTTGCTILIP
jgi:NADPH2:quinone reductase